ncbi:MAG: hypothetical protein ACE5IW_14050, partial [bacterium]
MQKSLKSTIKITDVNVRVLEADSSEIIQEGLEEQTDGSFQGVIQVPAGNNRIIEVTALNNSDIIAAGDTANVDILPGRSTGVEIQLAFVSGVKRNLTIVSGQDQQGFPGSSLPEPIVAKVSDVEGNGVSEIDVILRVIQGEAFFGNQLDSLLTTTNSAGLASAILFLENTPGEILVQVSANDRSGDPLVGSPDTVRATILAPPPPVISDFEPIIGTEGTPVTIRGENFNFP